MGLRGGKAAFMWRDLAGGIGETCEFVATVTNKAAIDLFAQCMYRALYEQKYRRNSENASPNDLLEFVADVEYVSNYNYNCAFYFFSDGRYRDSANGEFLGTGNSLAQHY